MDVGIDPAGRENLALSSDDIRIRPNDKRRVDSVHDIRVPCLSNPHDNPILDANIRLEDPTPVKHQRIHDNQVRALVVRTTSRLPDPITQRLPTTERALVAVSRVVLLDLDAQIRRPQTHRVAYRRPVHHRVRHAVHRVRFDLAVVAGRVLRRVQEAFFFQPPEDSVRVRCVDCSCRYAAAADDGL